MQTALFSSRVLKTLKILNSKDSVLKLDSFWKFLMIEFSLFMILYESAISNGIERIIAVI